MDNKIIIRGYPDICRICLVERSEAESFTSLNNKLQGGSSYWKALSDLCGSLNCDEEFGENASSDCQAHNICSNCTQQIDVLQAFRLETISNQLFLKAWIAYESRANADPLMDLFHNQTRYHNSIRKTLRRLGVLENDDTALTSLINDSKKVDSSDLLIKLEVETESVEIIDILPDSLYVRNDDNNDHENKQLQTSDGSATGSTHNAKIGDIEHPKRQESNIGRSIDGVRTRPCYPANCEPISLGRADEHSTQKFESTDLLIKMEVKTESEETIDPFADSLYVRNDDNNDNENKQQLQSSDDEHDGSATGSTHNAKIGDTEHPKRRKRNIDRSIDSVRTRPCYLANCEPIPLGRAEQHAREKHRVYCKLCGKVYQAYIQAVRHLATHKSDEDRILCEVCEKPFWRELDLKLHRRDFHGIDVANHECPCCGERFKRKADMLKHRDIHTGCKFCSTQCISYRGMMKHARKHHRSELIPCNSCQTRFLSTTELSAHETMHADGRVENCVQFPLKSWTAAHCQSCERVFFSVEYLQRHMENNHKQGLAKEPIRRKIYSKRSKEALDLLEYKFKCSDCSALFRLKSSLSSHWKKNHSGLKFICEHCGISFKSKHDMLIHELYLHSTERPFACDLCEKRFHRKYDLANHRRSHTNEKPYKCCHEGCDKAYKTRPGVTIHYRNQHSGEKLYKCSYGGCDKSYACSQLLKVHVRKHTLEKPFKCYYCELHFHSASHRSIHCSRRHVGLPSGREWGKLNKHPKRSEDVESTGTENSNTAKQNVTTVKAEIKA
ncbi:zinc finger protein 267-like [Armigeres subalbatus]|uniref:zinc finger protein 267-like n=1 Tax=Armigeres subalbatus TaxID=124917 RepID=UPI002ED3EC62